MDPPSAAMNYTFHMYSNEGDINRISLHILIIKICNLRTCVSVKSLTTPTTLQDIRGVFTLMIGYKILYVRDYNEISITFKLLFCIKSRTLCIFVFDFSNYLSNSR